MWKLVASLAADSAEPGGVSDQLIIGVGGAVVAAITALGGVLVAVVNARSNRTTPSSPGPTPTAGDHVLYERTAVLTQRADDSDDRFEVMDRRLDEVERRLDQHNPGGRESNA